MDNFEKIFDSYFTEKERQEINKMDSYLRNKLLHFVHYLGRESMLDIIIKYSKYYPYNFNVEWLKNYKKVMIELRNEDFYNSRKESEKREYDLKKI